jgi:hypothetical protein
MTHYWLSAQYLLASLLVLERLFGRGWGARLQRVGLAALLLVRMVLVTLVGAQAAGLEDQNVVGLSLCTMLVWSLLLLRASPQRRLVDWLRLEGLLSTGLILLCPAQIPVAGSLLSSGLPLLMVLAGPLGCSRYAVVRCSAGLAGLVLLVGLSHQLWLVPQVALVGPLAVFWFLALRRSRSVVRPAPFSPLALAVLLEDLSPQAQARLLSHLNDTSWIPWSPYHPHLISPWDKAGLKAAAEDWLENEFRHHYSFQPQVLAKSLLDWSHSSSQPTLLTGLTPMQEVAVLLIDLPPEVSAGLFQRLDAEFVQRLTLEISQLGSISPSLRAIVRQQFLGVRPQTTWESAARDFPARLAELLRRRYQLPPTPSRPWPRLRVAPAASCLLALASVGLWAEVGRQSLQTTPQGKIQALLDGTLGSTTARASVVERRGRLHCTVLLKRYPDQEVGQLERLVQAVLAPRSVEVHVVQGEPSAGGVSWLPCAALGVLSLGLVYCRRLRQRRVVSNGATPPAPSTQIACGARSTSYRSSLALLSSDSVTVEVGRGLLGLVDPNQHAPLLERVSEIRRKLGESRGFVLPGVRFRDHRELPPNTYLFRFHGHEVSRGEVQMNQLLARGCPEQLVSLRGTRVVDWDGQTAIWIREQKDDAERGGCELRSPADSVSVHLSHVIEQGLPQLLGIQEVQAWLDAVARTHPALVAAVVPARHDLVSLRNVLRELLRWGVSLHSAVPILETLADHGRQSASSQQLATRVLASLKGLVPESGLEVNSTVLSEKLG